MVGVVGKPAWDYRALGLVGMRPGVAMGLGLLLEWQASDCARLAYILGYFLPRFWVLDQHFDPYRLYRGKHFSSYYHFTKDIPRIAQPV